MNRGVCKIFTGVWKVFLGHLWNEVIEVIIEKSIVLHGRKNYGAIMIPAEDASLLTYSVSMETQMVRKVRHGLHQR
jgi:hypothetical protein